ncbi:AmmeMemoRadiSam system protein A [Vibrio sp. CAU 1672]|uniref:AmmeMemoRadiSam system protein A n=1 Tax=Vibrio sp. CAU 1672 TaxID=3032594 RepID=UPI0023D9E128|nr:AmmeMemoRadiSam system protein A [Vibrio sp. CAU 1672]MDF2155864.1 AmmeMemoRadiSam system protein A [Vibrio sp. CAU 1672]
MPASSSIDHGRSAERELIRLVWQVLEQTAGGSEWSAPDAPVEPELQQPGASFVTLYVNDELKGCIGTLEAHQPLWLDVCHNAYSSARRDHRFTALCQRDLPSLRFEISILSPLEPMINQGEDALLAQLASDRCGLLLEQGYRRAVFLPSVWQALPEPRAFLQALKRKGGWRREEWSGEIALFRFTTCVISSDGQSTCRELFAGA